MKASNIVAVITARKGSKRLPNKNKKLLCGKPLIQYSIEEALKSQYINEIIVTTDDEDIKEICKDFNVKVIDRPKELADDVTESEYAAFDAIKDRDKDTLMVLLQPTSPLRDSILIDKCIALYLRCDYFHGIITVYEEPKYNYIPSGDVYVINKHIMDKYGLWNNYLGLIVVPRDSVLDIDTIEDFEKAERILNDDNS